MRRLFTVTAMLVFMVSAIGCESCLFRGAKAQPQPYPTCPPPCDSGCAPGGVPGGGCSSCGPTIGAMGAMPGPAN